jgi:hypothetical protein
MPLILADRVKDTTTTTGTGTITLSGTAPIGYVSFGTAIGNGNTTYYTITAGSEWEVGIGTYTAAGVLLARTTVLASSNAGGLVNFSAGTKDVFVTYPAGKAISDGYGTLPVANGGTGATTAAGARTNLVAAASGANTDITALDQDVTITATGTIAADTIGYRGLPQNSQSAAYTLVLADAGKHIFHPVGDNNARTFTIPANSSVAFPVGTAITFINMAVANVTIAITTDTLTLSSAGTSGSRTLATNGSATCIKITSTQWLISGSGLT